MRALETALLLAGGFAYGYPDLALLGASGGLAVVCGVGFAFWRPSLGVDRVADPDRVARGEPARMTLTVRNTGESGANVTRVTPGPVGACGAPSPAPPQVLPGLGSVTYTWTCTALAAGELRRRQ